ncbi:MAG: flavin reductase family protein [Bacteroidetes bacterium]|nr:MAG: flavin reductase family protein [Bacteroidota bacterium]
MTIVPSQHKFSDIYKLLIGSVVPRPIAFVSSLSPDGVRNLAPFSFFNAVCSKPPIILFTTSVRADGKDKDTHNNIKATGEFVVNIVSESIAVQMNQCSADVPPEVDEFVLSGLTAIPGDIVKPPRVKESLINMECKLNQIVSFGDHPGAGKTIFGEVVLFHIADNIIDNFRIDPAQIQAIGRMGGMNYCTTRDRFEMVRP